MDNLKDKTIYFITGASGTGKTTLVKLLQEKYSNKNWAFVHFDSIGVPSPEKMKREYGSSSGWQEVKTDEWIKKLINEYDKDKIFFEGQVNIKFIIDNFQKYNFENYKIILIDCSEQEMAKRLVKNRKQPELATEDMKKWLKFLRNQSHELGVQVIDTTNLSEKEMLETFEKAVDL